MSEAKAPANRGVLNDDSSGSSLVSTPIGWCPDSAGCAVCIRPIIIWSMPVGAMIPVWAM